MKKILRLFGPGRLLAVTVLFGIAGLTVLAVPLVASAGDSDSEPGGNPLSVERCRERSEGEHPVQQGFLDELVADEVISLDQAAEIERRLNTRRFDACVAHILFERGNVIESTAAITGTEKREVFGAVIAGESLSQYANEYGVDDAALVAAIMEQPTAKADELVANGEITREEADTILSRIEERVSEIIQLTDIAPRRFRTGVAPLQAPDAL